MTVHYDWAKWNEEWAGYPPSEEAIKITQAWMFSHAYTPEQIDDARKNPRAYENEYRWAYLASRPL